jgi:hypothetical protein
MTTTETETETDSRPSRTSLTVVDLFIFTVPTAIGVAVFIPLIKAAQRARAAGEAPAPLTVPSEVTFAFYAACCLIGLLAIVFLCRWTLKGAQEQPAEVHSD